MTEEIKERFINPFTDFGFKRLFGTEPNKDLLIDFLNQLLPPKDRIEDLTFSNSETVPNIREERKAVFDIYCTNAKGQKFVVEMQKAEQRFFKDRSVFYASFPIQEQAKKKKLKKGEKVIPWNYELKAVYLVGVLNFTFPREEGVPDENEVKHVINLRDEKGRLFYSKMTLLFLEMPHFNKKLKDLKTNYDKWLWVLKHLPTLEEIPAELANGIFKKLFEVAEIAAFNAEEKAQYDASVKQFLDLYNIIDFAEEKRRLAEERADKAEKLLEDAQTALESSEKAKDDAEKAKDDAEKQAEADRLAKADAEKAKANAEKAKADAEAQNAILLAKMKAMEEEIKRIQKK